MTLAEGSESEAADKRVYWVQFERRGYFRCPAILRQRSHITVVMVVVIHDAHVCVWAAGEQSRLTANRLPTAAADCCGNSSDLSP
jgi:hypothetical protein